MKAVKEPEKKASSAIVKAQEKTEVRWRVDIAYQHPNSKTGLVFFNRTFVDEASKDAFLEDMRDPARSVVEGRFVSQNKSANYELGATFYGKAHMISCDISKITSTLVVMPDEQN